MKRLFSIVLLSFSIVLSSYSPVNVKKHQVKTVVIDAGHGGHDPGCNFAKVNEKDVALKIALKLGKTIKARMPDVKVIYTRTTDKFIELHERPAIGNRNNADVFISIHCNANDKTGISGTETYAMGLHKSEGNLLVAKRENATILLENNYEANYDGFDPNSPEAHIYFSLFQNAYLDQSLFLASKVENYLKSKTQRHSRGVKQAGFLVLWKAAMPSILIETGFLSNTTERQYLNSDKGQQEVANAVCNALKDYKTNLESAN